MVIIINFKIILELIKLIKLNTTPPYFCAFYLEKYIINIAE